MLYKVTLNPTRAVPLCSPPSSSSCAALLSLVQVDKHLNSAGCHIFQNPGFVQISNECLAAVVGPDFGLCTGINYIIIDLF